MKTMMQLVGNKVRVWKVETPLKFPKEVINNLMEYIKRKHSKEVGMQNMKIAICFLTLMEIMIKVHTIRTNRIPSLEARQHRIKIPLPKIIPFNIQLRKPTMIKLI